MDSPDGPPHCISRTREMIVIVDNLSRRNIDNELECDSLTPIQPMSTRLAAWNSVTGNEIRFVRLNVAKDYDQLAELILKERPGAVIHFAEQRTRSTPSTTTSMPPIAC